VMDMWLFAGRFVVFYVYPFISLSRTLKLSRTLSRARDGVGGPLFQNFIPYKMITSVVRRNERERWIDVFLSIVCRLAHRIVVVVVLVSIIIIPPVKICKRQLSALPFNSLCSSSRPLRQYILLVLGRSSIICISSNNNDPIWNFFMTLSFWTWHILGMAVSNTIRFAATVECHCRQLVVVYSGSII
jgi:hypothetical protein